MGERHKKEALRLFARLSDREHAVFEAGIALAAILHQLVGMPVEVSELGRVEESLSKAFSAQPFRKNVRIKVREEGLQRGKTEPYSYGVIVPEALDVVVEVEYGEARARARLRWVEELGYPLMYVEEVT